MKAFSFLCGWCAVVNGADLMVTAPIDLVLLTDATESMRKHRGEILHDTLKNFREVSEHEDDVRVGVMSFRDKPIAGYGEVYDYCVARHIRFTDEWRRVEMLFRDPGLSFVGGGRESAEDSLTALVGTLQDHHLGWRRKPIVGTPRGGGEDDSIYFEESQADDDEHDELKHHRPHKTNGPAVPIVVIMTDAPAWLGPGTKNDLEVFNGQYNWRNCSTHGPPSPEQIKKVLNERCGVLGVYLYDSPEGYSNGPDVTDDLDYPRRFWNQLIEQVGQPARNVRDFKNSSAEDFLTGLYAQAAEKYRTCFGDAHPDYPHPTRPPTDSTDQPPFEVPTLPVEWPTIPAVVPTMPVEWPTIPVEIPTMPVEWPTIPAVVPTMPVEWPTIPVVVPTMPVEWPTIPTETPSKPTASIIVPDITVDMPTVPVVIPTLTIPTAPIEIPTLPVNIPSVPIVSPTLPVDIPSVPIVVPTLPVDIPSVPIVSPTLPVEIPTAPIIVPTLPVEVPTVTIISPTLPVEMPTATIVSPTMPVDLPTLPPVTPTNAPPNWTTDCPDDDEILTWPPPPNWDGTSQMGQLANLRPWGKA